MPDPHVKTIYYRVKHADHVDYEAAPPLEHEEPGFKVRINKDQAIVEMKDHYATREGARNAVEDFLRTWEMLTTLDHQAGLLQFEYDHADVIDRSPTPGEAFGFVEGVDAKGAVGTPNVHTSWNHYPSPPHKMARDRDIDLMFHYYSEYLQGRMPLSIVAYYCLTVMEQSGGGGRGKRRKAAETRYAISLDVLDKLGDLSSQSGGLEARKVAGSKADYTAAERQWLRDAVKVVIRRAAEVAHAPTVTRRQITLLDLPTI
jgi:hypothetical protein